jgi:hypothetical protein
MVRSIPLSPLLSLLSRGGSHGVSSILLPSLSFLRSRCHCRRGSIPTSTQGAKRDLSLSELTPAGSEVVDVDSRGGGAPGAGAVLWRAPPANQSVDG